MTTKRNCDNCYKDKSCKAVSVVYSSTIETAARGDTEMNAQIVLESIRQHAEEKYNKGWCMVYLDNARPDGMNDKTFRAYLASLSKQGLYRVVDGYAWGKVEIV
jgi:hypothetical protein